MSASAARTAYATRADETAVVNLTGCDAQMGDIEKVKMQSGRFLLSRDIENTRPVAVIDAAAQASLFGNGNAVGQTIDLSGRRFSVVGVIAPGDHGARDRHGHRKGVHPDHRVRDAVWRRRG